jgi:small subunit ribosomal protein S5
MSTELKQVNKLKKTARRNDNVNDNKFIERLIKISRVTKVTKGGKKLSFRAVVVIGDENGQVGVGLEKPKMLLMLLKKQNRWKKKFNKNSNYKIIKYSAWCNR